MVDGTRRSVQRARLTSRRLTAVARILVRHSTRVRRGDVCAIQSTTSAEPLVEAVHAEVLRAGGLPALDLRTPGAPAAYLDLGSGRQLDWIAPHTSWLAESADVYIVIVADPSSAQGGGPAKIARRARALRIALERWHERTASGDCRTVFTIFPNRRYAMATGLSLARFEDAYFASCMATKRNPLDAWRRQSERVNRLRDWIEGSTEVRIRGRGTDLTFSVAGREFIAAGGERNMPDGEVFAAPLVDSVQGRISFRPTSWGGTPISGISLVFEHGQVVEASARSGVGALADALRTDTGASRVGEFGIGTNYALSSPTGHALLDEKMGGTVHLGLGASYPESEGTNRSAIHWDLVCDLRRGGLITVDGVELQRDGRFRREIGLSR